MNQKSHPVLVLILLVLVSSSAVADLPFFTVIGTVKRFDGQVAKNLKLRLGNKNRNDLPAVESQTDSQGQYRLSLFLVEKEAKVVKADEVLQLQVFQQDKLIASTEHRLTATEIELGFAKVDVKTFSPLEAIRQDVTVEEDSPPQEIVLLAEGGSQDQLLFMIETKPEQGQLSPLEENKVFYTPNPDFNGSDSFIFKVSDGNTENVEAIVSITVNPVNDAPAAISQEVKTDEDKEVNIILAGTDVDQGEQNGLNYEVVTPPTKGALSGEAQNWVYTPNSDFNGSDSFTFKVNDGKDSSAEATITLTVTPVDDPPRIVSLTPNKGPIAGGTTVVLSGSNFVEGTKVTLAGKAATGVKVDSLTQMTFVVPSGIVGVQELKLTGPDGLTAILATAFTYFLLPNVTSISSTRGRAIGGLPVTISGTNFDAGAKVTMGGLPASAVKVVSATEIQALTPARTAGAVDIVVTNADGQSGRLAAAFTYFADRDFSIQETVPLNKAIHVAVNLTEIRVSFSQDELIDADSVKVDSIRAEGQRKYRGRTTLEGDSTLVFRLQEVMADGDKVRVSISPTLQDVSANRLEKAEFTFTTGLGVWPGDTNQDEIVNLQDVLSLLIHWQKSGPPRQKSSQMGWKVQAAIPWSTQASTYADTNGDGQVDEEDVIAIAQNWHRSRTGVTAVAPLGQPFNLEAERTESTRNRQILRRMIEALERWPEATANADQLKLWIQTQVRRLAAQGIPAQTRLLANYPNPFNPETWIPYQLAQAGEVRIVIYDLNGERLRGLGLGFKAAAYYTTPSRAAYWDGRNDLGEWVSSGIYVCQLQIGDYQQMRRLIILK